MGTFTVITLLVDISVNLGYITYDQYYISLAKQMMHEGALEEVWPNVTERLLDPASVEELNNLPAVERVEFVEMVVGPSCQQGRRES